MEPLEYWRMQELSLVIQHIAELLKNGGQVEWSGVFAHYNDEILRMQSSEKLDINSLRKLLYNIKNCYTETRSFVYLELDHQNQAVEIQLNKDFFAERARLLNILYELGQRVMEYRH